jgi:RNA polymerase sigma factor (sigma-70 family)
METIMIDIEKYMHVVGQVTWRYGKNHLNWIEDMRGEGSLALWEAIQNWNQEEREEQGEGNFEAYARTCVRNAVLDFIRKEETRKAVMSVKEIDDWDANYSTPERQLLQKEREAKAANKLAKLLGTMNDREKYVLNMHILPDDPMTMVQIAKVWECDEASIRRDKKRILKRLEIKDEA